MRKIGNILTTEKYDEDPLFNVVDSIDKIDKSLPTLIIGWEKTKELFPDASILDWEINDKWFWTFGKRKRRNRFIEDNIKFKNMILDDINKSINYEFMDILTMSKEEKKVFIKLLKDDKDKVAYLKDNMIFILYNDIIVYGVSLTDIDYKGDNRKDFLRCIYNIPTMKVLSNVEIPHSIFNKIKTSYYIIPYLLKI